jgi:hypothetical protein
MRRKAREGIEKEEGGKEKALAAPAAGPCMVGGLSTSAGPATPTSTASLLALPTQMPLPREGSHYWAEATHVHVRHLSCVPDRESLKGGISPFVGRGKE